MSLTIKVWNERKEIGTGWVIEIAAERLIFKDYNEMEVVLLELLEFKDKFGRQEVKQ